MKPTAKPSPAPRVRPGWWVALLSAGLLSLSLNLWVRHHVRERRVLLWHQAGLACVTGALADEAQMAASLRRPGFSASQRKAFGQALGRLRDCWRQVSKVSDSCQDDAFFDPLSQLTFWMAQAVQLGEDSLRLRTSKEALVRQTAAQGLDGMYRNQCEEVGGLGQAALAQLSLSGADRAQAQAWATLLP